MPKLVGSTLPWSWPSLCVESMTFRPEIDKKDPKKSLKLMDPLLFMNAYSFKFQVNFYLKLNVSQTFEFGNLMAVLNSFLRPLLGTQVCSGSVRGPFGIRSGSVRDPLGICSGSVRAVGGPYFVFSVFKIFAKRTAIWKTTP